MARKKIVKSPDKPDKSGRDGKDGARPLDSVIVSGIWGLVYLAMGVLLLISMLFYSSNQLTPNGSPHILDKYFGTGLAVGMFYLFGRVSAFAFAAAVCYIGIAKFTMKPLRLKLLLFLALLALELCALLAVGDMPALAKGAAWWGGLEAAADAAGSNFIGLLIVSILVPLFGARTFGPYFIISLLMVITVCVGLRIRPQTLFAYLSSIFVKLTNWIKMAFKDVKAGIESSPDIISPSTSVNSNGGSGDIGADISNDPPSTPAKKSSKKIKTSDTPIPIINSDDDDAPWSEEPSSPNNTATVDNGEDGGRELTPEEEAKRRLDDERSAFRKKKREPIKVITMNESPDIDPLADAVVDDDAAAGDDQLGGENADGDQPGDKDEKGDLESDEFKVTEYVEPEKPYEIPSPDILSDPPPLTDAYDMEVIERTADQLEKVLMNFGVEGKVDTVSPGPVVIRYEIVLAPGIKISKVTNLQDDIAMAVGGQKVRIQAPIPGKAAIGIELPNPDRQTVHFKHILTSDKFKKGSHKLPVVIGSNISGKPFVADITKTPHLLVAGQTGSGKSVCIGSLICSMLMTKKPDELRLILIDPKMVEFTPYENIPHLMSPVVTESKEAIKALQWGVMEMERRYNLLKKAGVRKIDDFNAKFDEGLLEGLLTDDDHKRLPLVVIIVDELADLMMVAKNDVEGLIMRIAQKARAAGIHLILATQRPSVDIITGKIKANLPSRIAFRTVSIQDSGTILGQTGSEKLLGMGDMLFLLNGMEGIERFHGAYIPDDDVERIVAAIKDQDIHLADKISSFNDIIKDPDEEDEGGGFDDGKRDDKFAEAARLIISTGVGSTSFLQRRMEIGFARAGRLMDQLERAGIIGPAKGAKQRDILMSIDELEDIL